MFKVDAEGQRSLFGTEHGGAEHDAIAIARCCRM